MIPLVTDYPAKRLSKKLSGREALPGYGFWQAMQDFLLALLPAAWRPLWPSHS